MTEDHSQAELDHSCDPNFFAHYAEQSESAGTRQRFSDIRDKALKMVGRYRQDVRALTVLDVGCNAGFSRIAGGG